MPPRGFVARGLVFAAFIVGLAGCGSVGSPSVRPSAPSPTIAAAPTASAAPTPATPSPEPTARPSVGPAATASAASNTFVSANYNYALTLPPRTALVRWHAASRRWDGATSVPEEGPYTDSSTVAEGSLLIIGSPAESLDEFFARFEAAGPRFHGCNAAEDRVDATINGVPAIGFIQVCGPGEGFGRLALFKDGFGIGASIHTTADKLVPALDRLIELFDGLEWRTD
jgi:hypothetical protein